MNCIKKQVCRESYDDLIRYLIISLLFSGTQTKTSKGPSEGAGV